MVPRQGRCTSSFGDLLHRHPTVPVYLTEGDRKKAIEHFDHAAQIDGTVSDPLLERELGRTVRDARKTAPAPAPEPASQDAAQGGDTDEFSDEAFVDAQDWRPETFFGPDDPNRSRLTFDDVGGMEELKEEIRLKITYPLQFPDLYKAYGRKTGGGILVYGPPGCGKTLILRAVAGEVACNYLVVGLHEVFDPYYGNPERYLHQFFETARANAPCVMIFEDLDSLAQDRRQIRESQMRSLVNQFLHEMDGIRSENQRVLVIRATNQPWALDPAFRRPGRFDQAIFVPPPDAPARAQIIAPLAKDKPMADFDTGALVEATDDWFAAGRDGSTWYCGEEVKDYASFAGDRPKRPEVVSIDGSFKHGRDHDKAGLIIDFDFTTTEEFEDVSEYFLFDTRGKQYGGNAERFNWQLLKKFSQKVPFFLSGGIGPESIEEILQLRNLNLHAIDVNSGVEQYPGKKDLNKVSLVINKLRV